MGYGEIWKILDELVMEFRKRGETVPPDVIEDLRSAKTIIQVLKADPNRSENVPSIEMYLGNVESYLISEAHQKFGAEFADSWMKKLRDARRTVLMGEKEELESASKFVPGLPRHRKWFRVKISSQTPKDEIKQLADELGLLTKTQTDGYILVSGDEEKLKLFIQKTGEKLRVSREQ